MEDMVIRGYRYYTGFKACGPTSNIHETVKLKVIPRLCINQNGRVNRRKAKLTLNTQVVPTKIIFNLKNREKNS